MVIANNQLKAVATDSHRLSQRIIPLEMPETSNALTFEITLPGKTLIELSRIIDGLETIDFAITENQVLFQTETLSFYSRLLEGRYPDTDRLINDQFNTAITVVARDLVAAVDRASLMSHTDKNNIATLSINENRILLTGNSPEIGKVEEEITVENYEGASLDVSFNPDYLKDALRLFGSSEATIQFLEANRPFTLTLKDNHSDIPYSFIQLVTPVRTFNGY